MTLMRQVSGKPIVKIGCAIWEEEILGESKDVLGSCPVHALVLWRVVEGRVDAVGLLDTGCLLHEGYWHRLFCVCECVSVKCVFG